MTKMEFLTWETLATYAGALSAVMVLTHLTKGLGFFKRVPTQLWSYVLALCVLLPAYYFTGRLSADSAVLALLNGAVVALAANGGYDAISSIKPAA
ncbi:MAG: hypothetical protein RSC06_09335 [Clostridia bacterium]